MASLRGWLKCGFDINDLTIAREHCCSSLNSATKVLWLAEMASTLTILL